MRSGFGQAAKTAKVILYSGTTALQDVTVDSETYKAVGNQAKEDIYFDEASLSTLNCGTQYIVAIQPQNTGGLVSNLLYLTVTVAQDLTALSPAVAAYGVYRTDLGAWTNETTKLYGIEPILYDVTVAAGGIKNLNTVSGGAQ
jgi:hypothetical protein